MFGLRWRPGDVFSLPMPALLDLYARACDWYEARRTSG